METTTSSQRALGPGAMVPQPQRRGRTWLFTRTLHIAAVSAAASLLHWAVAEATLGKAFSSLPPVCASTITFFAMERGDGSYDPFPSPVLQNWGKGQSTFPRPQLCRAGGAGAGRERGALSLQPAPSWAGPASQLGPSPLEQSRGTCHMLTGLGLVSPLLPSALGSAVQQQSLWPSRSTASKIILLACKGSTNTFHRITE